ncbi:MAG TPA: hypothetical protein VG297_21885 [Bryobacteraceae bacterium]|jgi:hypothetical protein|nr:hypothetical protein [Bryobacteraceae bacterium]
MLLVFVPVLFLIAFGAIGLQFLVKMRSLHAKAPTSTALLAADRYRPMLRLLSDNDLAFVANSKLRRSLKSRRRLLFRGYLRCLTKDYATLLSGVRDAMVRSGMDRPDLARALARNRTLFALAICKVEFRLMLHATGAGTVDISSLVDALEALRGQVRVMTAAPVVAF